MGNRRLNEKLFTSKKIDHKVAGRTQKFLTNPAKAAYYLCKPGIPIQVTAGLPLVSAHKLCGCRGRRYENVAVGFVGIFPVFYNFLFC
jgi:hypothetical protein